MANKTTKATEIMSKEEEKASKIARYLPKIQEAQNTLSRANRDKLEAAIKIGKALIELNTVFANKKELGEWSEETVGIKVAQAYNYMALANPDNKAIVDECMKEEVGPTETNKRIRASKGNGGPKKTTPDFEYGVKRNSKDYAKPGEGNEEEVADQLYEAVRSVVCGMEGERSIVDGLLELLEGHVIEPKQANPGTSKKDAVPA